MELLILDGSEAVKLCLTETLYKPTISLTKGDLTISAELTDNDCTYLRNALGDTDIDEYEEEIIDLEKQVDSLEEEVEYLKGELNSAADEIRSLKEELRSA